MEPQTLELDTITEAWEDVKDLVHKLAWNFLRKYGGDREEVMAEAYLAFCRAFRAFDPERGCLTTVTQVSVTRQLMGLLDKRIRHSRMKMEPVDLGTVAREVAFDARGFCRQVSEDAAYMVRLVCGQEGNVRKIKRKLVEELKKSGWSPSRIERTMNELKGALEHG